MFKQLSKLQFIILNNIPQIIQLLWFLFISLHYIFFFTFDISLAEEQLTSFKDTAALLAHFKFMLQYNATINADNLVSWDLYRSTYLNYLNTEDYFIHTTVIMVNEVDLCTKELSSKYSAEQSYCICSQAVDNFYTKHPFHLKSFDYADTIEKFIIDKQTTGTTDIQGLIKAIEAYTLPQATKAALNPEISFDISQSLLEVDICLTALKSEGVDVSALIDNTVNNYLNALKNPEVQEVLLELSEQPQYKNFIVKKQLSININVPEFNPQVIPSWYLLDNVDTSLCGISESDLKELRLYYLHKYYQYNPTVSLWSSDICYRGIPSVYVFCEEFNDKSSFIFWDTEHYKLVLPHVALPKDQFIVVGANAYDIEIELLHLDAFIEHYKEQGFPVDNYIAQAVFPYVNVVQFEPVDEAIIPFVGSIKLDIIDGVTIPYDSLTKRDIINETTISFIAFIFPELFLVSFIIGLLLFNLIFKEYFKARDFVKFNICISFLCLFFLTLLLSFDIPINFFYLNFSFLANNWIINAKLFLLFLVFIVFLLSLDYFKFEKFQVFEYPLLILLSLLGMFILISANDFIILYLAVELQSFCFYILSALKRYSNLSIEAALKYFILGSFSSGILLFGISFIYGFLGTLNFNEINVIISFYDISDSLEMPIVFSLLFITLGVLFKLGVVPFHFWLPDVYEGSPTVVTAMFSILTKFSFLVLFIKIYFFVFLKLSIIFNNFFLLLALFSIILGSVMSLYQVKIKRLLAYSGITHMGYMLLALSLFSLQGLQAFLIYLLIYILLSANIFSVILAFRHNVNFSKIRNIVEFSSLLKPNFFLVIIFAFTLLSFAGVPPLAGFFGKFLVFYSLMITYNYFIALCVVLLSVLGSVYYIS